MMGDVLALSVLHYLIPSYLNFQTVVYAGVRPRLDPSLRDVVHPKSGVAVPL